MRRNRSYIYPGIAPSGKSGVVGTRTGEVALFSPNTIASIWAWFEADNLSLDDGDQVTTIQDQSANDRDFVKEGVAAATLTYQTNELNGQAVLRSNGTWLNVVNMSALTQGEYFLVQKMNSITTSGGHRLGATSISHYPFSGGLIYDNFGDDERKDDIVTAVDLQTWHCTHGWSAVDDWKMFQDGTQIKEDVTVSVQFHAAPRLGSNGTQEMNYDLAAAYFFSAKLSDEDRTGMKSRITAKYGITFA